MIELQGLLSYKLYTISMKNIILLLKNLEKNPQFIWYNINLYSTFLNISGFYFQQTSMANVSRGKSLFPTDSHP